MSGLKKLDHETLTDRISVQDIGKKFLKITNNHRQDRSGSQWAVIEFLSTGIRSNVKDSWGGSQNEVYP